MKSKVIFSIIGLIVLTVLVNLVWTYGFCRFYVPPGHMAIITAKDGEPLELGQILANEGQKGIQKNPLGPGRHFRNPYQYDWEIIPMKNIPTGKVGIVTSKIGKSLPPGEFIADSPDEKGIQRDPLGPGSYIINPHGYDVDDTVNAISIPIGFIGVVTSLSGETAPDGEFAQAGQKGVMEKILQPGLYYINPKVHKVDFIEVGVNQISLQGNEGGEVLTKNTIVTNNQAIQELQSQTMAKQQANRSSYLDQSKDMATAPAAKSQEAGKAAVDGAVAEFTLNQHLEFPSRDGFKILLDMTVEFELLPQNIAGIYRDYGDMPAVVEKILMPQILSVSRLKGSAYKATDFILGEGRETFQRDLTQELHKTLAEKNIEIHDALIRHVNVPESILDPLQQASIAVEQDQTNLQRQTTEKKQAELNTETQMIEQRSQEVEQETAKLRAEIEADKKKAVAEIEAEMTRQIAAIDRETEEILAERDVILGEAKADAIKIVEGEKAKGLDLKVKALGSPKAYTISEFAKSLNPDMKIQILHAGEGTLWTDGKFSQGEAALIKKTEENSSSTE